MNKIIVAALLVGISGTSLIAAPPAALNLKGLSADVLAKIESAKKTEATLSNALDSYITDTKARVEKARDEIAKRIAEHPYLKDNDEAKKDEDILTTTLANLDSILKALGDDSQKIQYDMAVTDTFSEKLATQTFPYACGEVKGGNIKGYIEKQVGRAGYAFYPTPDAHQKLTKIFKVKEHYEVGTIGKADSSPRVIKPSNPPIKYNGYTRMINGEPQVVCLEEIKE